MYAGGQTRLLHSLFPPNAIRIPEGAVAERHESTALPEPDLRHAERVVIESFRSARPQDAFETAVRAYRRHNPTVPNTLARRTVAKIICGGS
jgi:hypothetical protein